MELWKETDSRSVGHGVHKFTFIHVELEVSLGFQREAVKEVDI